jgi:hypothetical protein
MNFYDEIEDGYGIYDVEDNFDFMTYSSFYSFFSANTVDVPKFFKKTKSIKRQVSEITFLKFNNFFMRKGKRVKTTNLLNRTLFNISSEFGTLKDLTFGVKANWKDFFIVFNNLNYSNQYENIAFSKDETLMYGNVQSNIIKNMITNWKPKTILFRNIYDLLTIFSFYIYKVDKQIFKNTRGRSGKYTFVWKYITQYKRRFLVMFWLLRELRVTQGRSLIDRLTALLNQLIFNPNKT